MNQANGPASWSAYNGLPGQPGSRSDVSATIVHVVNDDPVNGSIGKIEVLAAHNDMGKYYSLASGPGGSDGAPTYRNEAWADLAWDFADNASPTLPSTVSFDIHFTAKHFAFNMDNMAGSMLTMRSTFINVDISSSGLVVADPNASGPGLTLPPGVYSPGGAVIYYDASFGMTSNDGADIEFTSVVSTGSAATLPIFMQYDSRLNTPGLEELPPSYPDHTWYQDGFDWSLTFDAS